MNLNPKRSLDNAANDRLVDKRHGDADRLRDPTLASAAQRPCRRSIPTRSLNRLAALLTAAAAGAAITAAPISHSAPAPEIEYLYNVEARRHFNFPANSDPVGYGRSICDKVSGGEGYAQLITDIRGDVTPNDEPAANYLLSYAVNLLCPEKIWQLRHSAAGYQPPPA
jgi:Protein of unknown function (DUF732)